ncbi:tripartite tricarboxylate transporter substrate binding protein [Bosea sp. (in: a-proteobacteria)]|jgi:tripartite-type tricarboxylate transporter receptor subunit TctC|uniref:Bug family tripartite tricarboxylate transporter substrate binding protein n=1 Tax=Bosea sp. (in: a-proteobacteria) TaxID=1871050 RepID=UPI002DDD7EC7|nr:tripartite tricarboxylate transporter substrate binding protein [Bosea sp. (in: a-proteobacteria)]HEV2508405.1 tripartite tricarboxylate transporter substrate binding protein [Bosea sp. (in: a-proteobacteria)]
MIDRRQLIGLPFLAPLLVASARAQGLSTRPVTIVSPYAAGGTSDIIARILGEGLHDLWKQPVLIENRPGANGAIGVSAVARAEPDGHTLLAVASSALTLNPLLYKKLAYDVERDLAPVTVTGLVPNVVVVHPKVPARSLQELVAFAKAKPGGLTYASQGIGSNGQMNAELFRLATGVPLLHVPYKGSAQAVTDLVGGQVDLMFDNLPTVLEHIRGAQLRALAVTSAGRSPLLPDVPTVSEAAIPGFDTAAWFAVLAPKATSPMLLAQLETAIASVLARPGSSAKLAAAGVTVAAAGSAELSARILHDRKMWSEVIAKAGIAIE